MAAAFWYWCSRNDSSVLGPIQLSMSSHHLYSFHIATIFCDESQSKSPSFLSSIKPSPIPLRKSIKLMSQRSASSSPSPNLPLRCSNVGKTATTPLLDYHDIDQQLLHNIAYDALVWSSLNGLLVGDKSVEVRFLSSS